MASEELKAAPSIVEPTPSSRGSTPSSLTTSSLDPISSSSSPRSVRSRTLSSSATSQAGSSSSDIESDSVPKSVPAETKIEKPPIQQLPDNEKLPPKSPRTPEEQTPQDQPPSSTPRAAAGQTQISNHVNRHTSAFPTKQTLAGERWYQWSQAILGVVALVVALISMLFYGIRSYKMAVWTTRNDELQACTGLIQVRRFNVQSICAC